MLTMQRQEGLAPQYRSAPRITQVWRLLAVSGEPGGEGEVGVPGPGVGPEEVVAAQLAALREERVEGVWLWASPDNKRATGPVEHFARMLQAPMYQPLVGHSFSEPLRRYMFNADTYMELVGVVGRAPPGTATATAKPPARWVYMWVVGRQPEGSEAPGAWMTQAVQLVTAEAPQPPPL
mmetsp:Transcript_21465/g.54665  ORF Transcript_21465/g.54665 Transcript_21465/m.54665 type:complete len:179 (-) Transcript_21465:472-1008(-)